MKLLADVDGHRSYQLEDHEVLPDDQVESLGGTLLNRPEHVRFVVSGQNATVFKPDGSPLLVYRHEAIPASECKAAWEALRKAATPTDNRGMAAGAIADEQDAIATTTTTGRKKGKTTRLYFQPVKRDGTLSNTNYATVVHSGIVGYFDRYVRIPYCRTTAYTLTHPERFAAALPFIRRVASVFQEWLPDRHAAQQAMIERTHPDFVIHGTPFTTITVNKNWQTAVHQDAGDYKPGFGVMSVLQGGRYEGGVLVFPKYGVGVDMRTRGVCLADVHEFHGNTPIVGVKGLYERISCVFYYRANMHRCGSARDELVRAKSRKEGDPLYDDEDDA